MNLVNLAVLVLSVAFLVSGCVDVDWMVVSYRYSEWHRSVDYWEFNPYLRLNWWLAYVVSLIRVVAGSIGVGYLTRYYLMKFMDNGGKPYILVIIIYFIQREIKNERI